MILLDTDVVIDILRGYPPAVEWLESLGDTEVGLPGLVVMELIQGERSFQSADKLLKFLRPYSVSEDCQQALVIFAKARFSHHLGLLDALIGLTARGIDQSLCTFNQRHYRAIPGLKTIQPYEK